MSSLPREVHEVLEHEYVSMYGPLDLVDVRYTAEQILDVQWVLSILRTCELDNDQLTRHAAQAETIDAARRSLAEKLNAIVWVDARKPDEEENRIHAEQRLTLRQKLIHSPALTACGRTLIAQYDELFAEITNDDELHELHRRIVDDAFGGAVKPLRDLRLALVYAKLHERAQDPAKARTALCISGGGIRSATFAMGVIQGLASAKILDKFDFLSTVSGGGYIGSWLSSWARRHPHGMSGVQDDLAACDTAAGWVRAFGDEREATKPEAKDQKLEPEPKPVRHLRDYSNYLSPRLGLFSGDAWTMAALYIRNLLLNLLVLIPVIAAVLAIPRAYAYMTGVRVLVPDWLYPCVTVVCLFLAFRYIGLHRPVDQDSGKYEQGTNADLRYFVGCILPLLGAAISITLFWADVNSGLTTIDNWWVYIGAVLAAGAATLWPYVVYYRRFARAVETAWRSNLADADVLARHLKGKKIAEGVGTLLGFGTIALVLYLLATEVFNNPLQDVQELITTAEKAPADRAGASLTPWSAVYTCFAVPCVLLVFYIQGCIFIGISSHRNEDHDREWWGRAGGWLLITAFGWAVLSGVAVFGPVALYHSPIILGAIGGGAGLVAALLGYSANTPANKKEQEDGGVTAKAGNAALGLATPLFVICFLAFISLGVTWLTHKVKPGFAGSPKWESRKYALDAQLESRAVRTRPSRHHANVDIVDESDVEPRVSMAMLRSLAHYRTVQKTEGWEVAIMLALAGLAYWLSRCIGVNKFSMHALYRNRLIRAYLGASRYTRRPHPFTGFDDQDDLQMYHLRPELLWPMNLRDPQKFFAALKEGFRKTQTGLAGKSLGRRKLAQHLWARLYESTRKQVEGGRVTHEAIDAVIHNINTILLDERQALEEVEDLGLDDTFWAWKREGQISHPAVLRNRAVLDHFFSDVITPMPRPKDVPSAETAVARGAETMRETGKGAVRRPPLHVVNVALNLVAGEKLAWQQRKAAPFTISPYDSGSVFVGYRDSRLYGGREGITLGTAVTISGAAASPNMGYHSSPSMGFLMTLFNVRLGWWLGNPGPVGQDVFRLEHPKTNLGPIISEMTGSTNERYDWVYLSDGGHFENLGLYEMVLRRCHYIVLSDAGADPQFAFDDLGNAIRKIRTDLGVPIDIEEMFMFPRSADGMMPEGRYVATATIRYTAVDGKDAKDGLLIYLKPGIYKDDYFPRDVFNYALLSRSFPHESTADQFFSESQFESYRALGRHVVNEICCNYPHRASTVRPRIPIAKEFQHVAQFAEFVEDKARATRAVPPEEVIAQAIRETRLMS